MIEGDNHHHDRQRRSEADRDGIARSQCSIRHCQLPNIDAMNRMEWFSSHLGGHSQKAAMVMHILLVYARNWLAAFHKAPSLGTKHFMACTKAAVDIFYKHAIQHHLQEDSHVQCHANARNSRFVLHQRR
jgi:hypothetical protein